MTVLYGILYVVEVRLLASICLSSGDSLCDERVPAVTPGGHGSCEEVSQCHQSQSRLQQTTAHLRGHLISQVTLSPDMLLPIFNNLMYSAMFNIYSVLEMSRKTCQDTVSEQNLIRHLCNLFRQQYSFICSFVWTFCLTKTNNQ